MVQAIVQEVIAFVPRAIGWAFLKLVTLGRYRGFRDDDLLLEGGVGVGLIAGLCFLGYRFWPR
jgi:hypothetical protein